MHARIGLMAICAAGACSLLTDFGGIEGGAASTTAGMGGGGPGGAGGAGGSGPDNWFRAGYPFRKRLTLDTTVTTIDLTNVPLAIVLSDPDLDAAGYADGRDIAFTAADGVTQLPHELEKFKGAEEPLVAWVNVPAIAALTPVDVYIYFGDPNAGDQQNLAGTWPEETFRGVWHLSQNPDVPGSPMLDSSVHGNHGVPDGDPQLQPGVAGDALSFGGDGDRVGTPNDDGAFDFGTMSFSFSLWAFVTEYTGGGDTLMNQVGLMSSGFTITMAPGQEWIVSVFADQEGDYASLGADSPLLGRWVHAVGVVDRVAATLQSYADGAFITEDDMLLVGSLGGQAGISICPGGNPCKGIIDEARIYNTALGPDWIALEHRNLDPGAPAFVSAGMLEQQ